MGIRKIVIVGAGLLAAPIILVGGLVTLFMFFAVYASCFLGAGGCSGTTGAQGAVNAERASVPTAMNAMMADKYITTVTPNDDSNNSLGVNTWTALPEGADAASLDGYLVMATTVFYYCWDSRGRVYTQNKKDGREAAPVDAEIQRPCKKSPPHTKLQTAVR